MKTKKQTATKQASTKAKATESDTTEPKTAKVTTPAKADAKKKLSQIEAAVAVLAKAGEAMNCQAMVEAMGQQGLWTSPGGATPASTLYASTLREINAKGKHARLKRIERGQFALVGRK
jgi:DNA-directed RNA polymerase beta' subunit